MKKTFLRIKYQVSGIKSQALAVLFTMLCALNSVLCLAQSPVANFIASSTSLCATGCITFTDQSTNSPTSWVWSFPGAATTTSTAQNPANICYNAPGTYDVTLKATNSNGSDSLTKTGYIIVTPQLSGIKSVGPTGDYSSITTCLAAIQNCGFTGNLILELQSAYISSVETFPITFSSALGSSFPSHTITLRPAAGATGLVITTSNPIAIDLNGVQGIIIDGRLGGTGGFATTNLTIGSTSTAAYAGTGAIRFINGASSNQIIYSTLNGNNNSASGGIIVFSNTNGGSGNSTNTIDHCAIKPTNSTLNNGIYSLGTTTTAATQNTDNIISNNNFDFCVQTSYIGYYYQANAAGIFLDDGNQNWLITGNSFFMTQSYFCFNATWSAIVVNPASANVDGTVITGNYIGGTAPHCVGTMTYQSRCAAVLRAIWLKVGTTVPTSVQGNTIQNISLLSYAPLSPHALIYIVSGSADVGTVTPNVLGSQSSASSILYQNSNVFTSLSAIQIDATASSSTINIKKNIISGFMVQMYDGPNSNEPADLYGISFGGSGAVTINIDSNIIGNVTPHISASLTNASIANVYGIYSSSGSSSNTVNITNNTIDSIASAATNSSTYHLCYGIFINGSWACNISGNTIRHMVNKSFFSGVSVDPVLAGVSYLATGSSSTISQNRIYALSTTTTGTVGAIMGIRLAGTLGSVFADGNLIYQLAPSSASQSAIGIQGEQGSGNIISNNMISLGFNASGNSITTGSQLEGIYDLGGNSNYYFNSVQIGGTGVTSSVTNHAFRSAVTSGVRAIKNNIFSNVRSDPGNNSYAVALLTANGLNIDYNNYFADTIAGGILGNFNGASKSTLAAWQTATSKDANTINVRPVFVSNSDLHLNPNTNAAIDGQGIVIAGITVDYDGDTRSTGVRPNGPDMGADEFTGISVSADNLEVGNLQLQIYPNPVSQSATISLPSEAKGKIEITIMNTLGEKVYALTAVELKAPAVIDVSSFSNGIYLLQIRLNQQISNHKFVVVH